MKEQGLVVWFYGLSGSGKTTLALKLNEYLKSQDVKVKYLDGDELRETLNSNLGFSNLDRDENIRRVATVAKFFVDSGFITICSLITPTMHQRNIARNIIGDSLFKDIYVDSPLEKCIERDVKGLYKEVLLNNIKNFTGISTPFEIPTNCFYRVNTEYANINDSFLEVLKKVESFYLQHD